ncbi:MAG: Mov34/MPN/PAD-1 family protein [Candidatus Hodarchaeota archaeon]
MSDDKKLPQNIFELLLRDLSLTFDPQTLSFTLKFPFFSLPPDTDAKSLLSKQIHLKPSQLITKESEERFHSKSEDLKKEDHHNMKQKQENGIEIVDLDLNDLDPELELSRVKIHLKAYIKLALHALKYANPKLSRNKWIEVIGLLTGHIENKDTPIACLVVEDAYPIGHGTDVNAQIQDPQSMVRVYNEIKLKTKNQIILGWYHSHPSYGAFMSQTDYQTQVRYQRLGTNESQITAPIALVIDPTRISTSSYGFKIFRLKDDLKSWEEPNYQVLNCPLESLPEMMNTLLPLAGEHGRMFLEYDHEK